MRMCISCLCGNVDYRPLWTNFVRHKSCETLQFKGSDLAERHVCIRALPKVCSRSVSSRNPSRPVNSCIHIPSYDRVLTCTHVCVCRHEEVVLPPLSDGEALVGANVA